MDVSTFELIFKPQSPAAPSGVAAVDRVIQGYFLAITNLEDKAYSYRLEFIVPPVPPATPNAQFRTPAENTLTFVDTGGGDNAPGRLTGTAATTVFLLSSGLVQVPARATALVAVLPSAFGPTPLDPTPLALPTFETRGYVRIFLPALISFPPLRFVAQSATPVRVLLTPQHRATFLKADNTISDQIQATLPLADGAARVTIPPEPGGPFVVTTKFPAILGAAAPGGLGDGGLPSELRETSRLLETAAPDARGLLLATLLGSVGEASSQEIDAFNASLAQLGVPMTVGRAPARPPK
jgi:hypothetical protein